MVISPLLALQQDQIDDLRAEMSEKEAVRISSAETERQHERALRPVPRGHRGGA